MQRFPKLVLLLILALSSWGLSQGLERQLTIEMGEMYFQGAGQAQNEAISLDVGVPYRITFRNVGDEVHRVKFGRGLIVEEGVPFAYAENLFTKVPVKVQGLGATPAFRIITNELIELDLEAGQEVEVLFTLPSSALGNWELGCFVIGHYEAGMRTDLNVR